MNSWRTVELGEIAEFRNGLNYAAADSGTGLAVVGVSDFQNYSFVDFSKLSELSPSALSKNEALIIKGDILFVRSNGNRDLIGRSLLVDCDPPKPTSHSGFTIRLRFTDRRADPRFFAYHLRGDTIRRILSSQGGGTSINNLNQGILARLQVPLPSLETQSRIASILGAYDDLIDVNRRRVAVLEEMAGGLFEEWFVRFRFPGHETVPIVNAQKGKLPDGWLGGSFRDLAVLKSGFAFKSSSFVEGGQYSLVTIKHVHAGKLVPSFDSKIDEIPAKLPSHCQIARGDMLISLTGNVGRTCLAWGENLLLNQRVAKVCWVSSSTRAYSYFWLRQPNTVTLLQNISNGAAQQNLSPVRTMDLPVVVPPNEILGMFEKAVGPMLDAIVTGFETISILQKQRDLLLPRLISGQLMVAAAESKLDEAA